MTIVVTIEHWALCIMHFLGISQFIAQPFLLGKCYYVQHFVGLNEVKKQTEVQTAKRIQALLHDPE